MNHVDVKVRWADCRPDWKQFKKKTNTLYNFRCPICGDSEKNRYKARGYLYPSKDEIVLFSSVIIVVIQISWQSY